MTQGKVSETNKLNDGSLTLVAPPSYEEVTAGGSPSHSEGFPSNGVTLTAYCWDDVNIRRAFIRKVYATVALQLSCTLAAVSLFTFCDPVRKYIQSNPGWYWAAYIVFFVTYMTLALFSGPRRRFPWNLILLTIFTVALSFMTGMISSYFNTMSVIICLGITVLVCFAITIFSFQTKIDMTLCVGVMFSLSITLTVFGLFWVLPEPSRVSRSGPSVWSGWQVSGTQTLFACLGALLFSLFLAFDTQLMMGNKRLTISPEDYIFAALSIYLDISYIFVFILRLFGCERN